MRHRVAHRKLGRKTAHRIATLRTLSSALFTHERVETTMGKAKELRSFAERLITRARKDSLHSRRLVARRLRDSIEEKLVQRLFDEIAPRFADRPGGYTRIVRTAPRRGDNAEMAIVELVERKEKAPPKAAETPARGRAKKGEAAKPETPEADGEPAKVAKAKTAKPTKGAKSARAAKPAKAAKPAEAGRAEKKAEPEAPAQPERPGKPGKPGKKEKAAKGKFQTAAGNAFRRFTGRKSDFKPKHEKGG
jgi:large subunit ribosomal protein L17